MVRFILHIADILAWADAFFKRWSRWPNRDSGPVDGQLDMTWCGIDQALQKGHRGLRRGSSLAQLLAEHRGVRNRSRLPRLTERKILACADPFRANKGYWPTLNSGPVDGMPGETWGKFDKALYLGRRGLPGGSSLAQLLAERRGVRPCNPLPPLTVAQVVAWLDDHFARKGYWPTRDSGPIPNSGGECWAGIAESLYHGTRGLPKTSLASLLAEHRGIRNRKRLPPLRIKLILPWLDAHKARTGMWPIHTSGPIPEAPGETWSGVHTALKDGIRGLPGGSSLYKLLKKYRGVDRTERNRCRKLLEVNREK